VWGTLEWFIQPCFVLHTLHAGTKAQLQPPAPTRRSIVIMHQRVKLGVPPGFGRLVTGAWEGGWRVHLGAQVAGWLGSWVPKWV